MKEQLPITYDNFGRMKYHPDFHQRNGQPWTREEIQYVIDYYDYSGSEEMSLALERTITTVQTKVSTLRKRGLMPPADKKKWPKPPKK